MGKQVDMDDTLIAEAIDLSQIPLIDLSRFLNAQSAEVTQLGDSGFALIQFGQQPQRSARSGEEGRLALRVEPDDEMPG